MVCNVVVLFVAPSVYVQCALRAGAARSVKATRSDPCRFKLVGLRSGRGL